MTFFLLPYILISNFCFKNLQQCQPHRAASLFFVTLIAIKGYLYTNLIALNLLFEKEPTGST